MGLRLLKLCKKQFHLGKCLEVIVSMDGRVFLHGNLPKYLHSDDPVDEEDEDDEESNPGKRLERLDEGVEKLTNGLALGEQFYLVGWGNIVSC